MKYEVYRLSSFFLIFNLRSSPQALLETKRQSPKLEGATSFHFYRLFFALQRAFTFIYRDLHRLFYKREEQPSKPGPKCVEYSRFCEEESYLIEFVTFSTGPAT